MTETLVIAKAKLIKVYGGITRAKTLLAAGCKVFTGQVEPTKELYALGTVLNVVDNVLETALDKVDAFWEPAKADA